MRTLCRLLDTAVCKATGRIEPWFRPIATEVDYNALRASHWGAFFVCNAPQVLGAHELCYLRGRRGYLTMAENLLTTRQSVRPAASSLLAAAAAAAAAVAVCPVGLATRKLRPRGIETPIN